jgi:antitoxin VapB
MTRYVHFGAMPSELEDKFAAVAQVNAASIQATREGATADELFSTVRESYAVHGHPGEEEMHHQGGATGYWEREWLARPGGSEQVLTRQAMAWNPNIQGAKIEDTVVLNEGTLEVLTSTPDLPVIETTCNGKTYRSAGVLFS